MQTFFITGTDTHCGKTYLTCQLLAFLNKQQKRALALKPVASGCYEKNGQLYNDDVLTLQKYNCDPTYPINAWQFVPPISPHIAAKNVNQRLTMTAIADFCLARPLPNVDYLFIEGAGGLMAPLNDHETWLDFLKLTQIPSILVVGMRLGCLNHALLTAAVLKSQIINCTGWIANCLTKKMIALDENINTLSSKLYMPLLAVLPFQGKLKKKHLVNNQEENSNMDCPKHPFSV